MGDLDVLTPLINSQEPSCSQGFSVIDSSNAWGRLYPENESLKIVVKDIYKVGRQAHDVDCQFTKKCFSTKIMNHISKIHFVITREKLDNKGFIVFITDTSSNGTYLNGELIGKNCRWVLSNNDKIAVISKSNKVYTFTNNNLDNPNFPMEVRSQLAVYGILGTGTFGEVRLAFGKKTSECFALKKIKRESYMAFREHTILSSLSHPNIVKMDNFIDANDAIYICLEYMPGGSLQDLLKQVNTLKETETKIILYQVARAVQYLHNRSIAHRDLKPGNILLSLCNPYCQVKLADFGLSKIVTENTYLKTFCGSLAYLAPEVFVNYKRFSNRLYAYTNKVDSWSFGIILYECLAGYKPFSGNNLDAKIQKGSYDLSVLNVSNGVKDLVKKLIMVDYTIRFNFDQVLDHAWFDKDVLMKRNVSDLIAQFSTSMKTSNKQIKEKENSTKKTRFCPCLMHTTSSCSM
ncbi:serine/threonine-protein kinase Chk2-like isoform X2 [Daktulosphaira vitifoliae]|uniref:serine/threonine-protein kinase Chk2-like isoform X2 n=1 Tax=Daktulosphaira vitifoliae TaxID=58002 RepID=UPI0021AAF164|nr:serine/threonine-protein kinase Chk2-like isoform X2 [Daktulosphaira vitifoliae]